MAHATGRRTRVLFDEYIMENGGLTKLARSPVKKVMLSNLDGFQEKEVPEKNQDRLMIYAAALLKELGG